MTLGREDLGSSQADSPVLQLVHLNCTWYTRSMELSRPGADILGETPAALLRALSRRTSGVSGRELGRLAGVSSPSSTHRALAGLVRTGLVTATESSHATLFTLNHEHALWKPIEGILEIPTKIDHMIEAIVGEGLGRSATVALFGSVARGNAEAGSDIDLALVVADEVTPESIAHVSDQLVERLRAFTGNSVQVVAISQGQLAGMVAARDPLIRSWAAEARTISGPELKRTIAALP